MPKKKPTPRVRPPRAPKGESPFVTIANLENHVSLLTKRCEDLVKARDHETESAVRYVAERDQARHELREAKSANNDLRETVDDMGRQISSLLGYKERIREEDRHRYGDFPSVIA